MKSSIDHIPLRKQRELERALKILHEEFDDVLRDGTAEFKKRGRILKIILFGSYAKGGWVDEPFTMKGYRSDFDPTTASSASSRNMGTRPRTV